MNFLFCESLIVVYVDFHPLCCELIRFFYAKNNQNLEILEYIFKKISTNNEDNENYKVKAKNSISIDIKKQVIDDVVTGISYDAIMQKYKLKNKSNS